MAIKLIVESLDADFERDDLVCEQTLITFGKGKHCLVELNNDQIDHQHFIIRFVKGNYIIMDQGSHAGTLLDGELLEPLKIYELSEQHQIAVPGFNISVFNDGCEPRMERTTVVARRLLGQILSDAQTFEQYPRLESKDARHNFIFTSDKSSFVLGRSAHQDFVIAHDETVCKEHVSFIRDIFGVRAIPIMDAVIKIDRQEINEPHILKHGEVLEVGAQIFIFKDHVDEDLPMPSADERPEEVCETPINDKLEKIVEPRTGEKNIYLKAFDKIFLGLFALATIGVSLVLVVMFL